MEFNLRDFEAPDLFTLVRILKKIGLKEIKESVPLAKIKDYRKTMASKDLTDDEKTGMAKEVGTEIMLNVGMVVLENLPEIEADIYKFSASIAGMKESEVKKLKAKDFMDLIIAIFTKDEFADFFVQASKLTR